MKKKILIIAFRHETNSFCPKKADETAYRNIRFYVGEDAFSTQKGLRNEMGAFLCVLEQYDEFELIPSVLLGATPSGPVTADVYNFVLNEVSACIRKFSPIDGVLLASHGAMVAEGHDDGEGDLFEFIRNLVGWEIPVISSLDLHANVTEKMARCATALIPYEKYPHIDTYETGYKAATIMAKTLLGEIKPVMAYRKIPFLMPLLSDKSPQLMPLYNVAEELNRHPDVLSVRFAHGFFPSDIEELGISVLAVTDNNKALSEEYADKLCSVIYENIPNITVEYPKLDETLDRIMASDEGPYVIADASDNPGAGGMGDTTHILKAVLERGIKGAAFATITDAQAVDKCIEAGVGATVGLELGGKSDAFSSGGPLKVSAYVKKLSDGKYISKAKMSYGEEFKHGKTAVVEINGNLVIVTSFSRQPYDIEIFKSHGIDPKDQKILVVKSAVHYKATFKDVAKEMITLALPGYSVPVPQGYKYKKWKN